MKQGFFNGWELWQKMTFVLAVAIALVFCLAYGKLVWMNRLLKKKEVIDEEMRTRIKLQQQSGQILKSSKADVLFGVRAIQSGIQVDGIWISNTNAPVLSELRPGEMSNSPDSISGVDSNAGGGPPSSKPIKSTPKAPVQSSLLNDTDPGSGFSGQSDQEQALDASSEQRQSYRPRKASQLRHDGHGAFDEVTLRQLEGTTPANAKHQAHQTRPFQQKYVATDSPSAADNELNSGTPSESDISFSDCKGKAAASSSKPDTTNTTSEYFPVSTGISSYEMSGPLNRQIQGPVSSRNSTQMPSWIHDVQSN